MGTVRSGIEALTTGGLGTFNAGSDGLYRKHLSIGILMITLYLLKPSKDLIN